ncbi:MAG: TonB-dependent receptor [Rikenellaceae bacterium]
MMKITQSFYRTLILCISALVLSVSSSFAQNIEAKGVVTDGNGEPIIGANVIIKGTNDGVATNIDGEFSLSVPQNGILLFSSLGYTEIERAASTNMTVVLTEDSQILDDVVVVGYGVVRKKELTGAVSQVKSEELSKQVTSNLGSALQGMVSGVSVTAASSAPGATTSILIRGVSSIYGDNTPLYIVDGVPQESDPSISPNDIETIDILKDAASCAIYGTRGAAGVIIITTKKGSEGKLKIDASASYGVNSITSRLNLMNAVEQTYFNMCDNRAVYSYTLPDEDFSLDLHRNDTYFYNDTNLMDYVYVDNAVTQNYTATVSGGSKGLTYSVMAGYYDQEGSVINSSFSRMNTRFNVNYKADRLTFAASVGTTEELTNSSPSNLILQSIKYSALQPAFSTDQTYYSAGGDEQNYISDIMETYSTQEEKTTQKSFATFNLGYEILDGLTITGLASFNRRSSTTWEFCPYMEVVNSTGTVTSLAEDSYVSNDAIFADSFVWEAGLNYQKEINKHKITAMATATSELYNYSGFSARKEGVIDNSITVLDGTSINDEVDSYNSYTNKLIGTVARVLYDWNSRYMLSASVRADASSKFTAENRWGVFPSASAAWNVYEENFFEPLLGTINNFKIRASYGTTGNQSFGAYTYAASITTGYDALTGTGEDLALGSIQSAYANPDVKWETSKQFNIGFDMGFFDNKLTLSAEYYNTEKSDMLFSLTLPGSTGSTSNVTLNVGDMTNSGYELALQYRDNIGKLKYNLSGTFSTTDNLITKINGEGARIASSTSLISDAAAYSQVCYIAEGYPAGAIFLYETNGIINTEEELAAYSAIDSTAKYGDLIYVDYNGDGVITDDDRQYMGSGISEYEIGLNIGLEYRNFDLFVNLYSALGHELVNGSKATSYTYGKDKDLLGMWTPSNTDSTLPTYYGTLKEDDNYAVTTDMFLEDGSYLRLKNISLGYTLPTSLFKSVNISKVRFYVSAQNLFTITNYTGMNPEVGSGITTRGMDFGLYPSYRTYLFGLDLSF